MSLNINHYHLSFIIFYLYKSESMYPYVRVCVHVARQLWAVAMQQGRFLWGPFWEVVSQFHAPTALPPVRGCCLATTISRWCFIFGPVAGQWHNNGVAFSLGYCLFWPYYRLEFMRGRA
jgi:hypothetical protein